MDFCYNRIYLAWCFLSGLLVLFRNNSTKLFGVGPIWAYGFNNNYQLESCCRLQARVLGQRPFSLMLSFFQPFRLFLWSCKNFTLIWVIKRMIFWSLLAALVGAQMCSVSALTTCRHGWNKLRLPLHQGATQWKLGWTIIAIIRYSTAKCTSCFTASVRLVSVNAFGLQMSNL